MDDENTVCREGKLRLVGKEGGDVITAGADGTVTVSLTTF